MNDATLDIRVMAFLVLIHCSRVFALARRNILRANPRAKIDAILGNFLEAEIASRFIDCDYLFLASDSMRARLLFNTIVHQYLIPGVQVGAKVQVDKTTGEVVDVFSVVRPVTSESGCLLCNGLINSAKLQEESISEGERKDSGTSMSRRSSRPVSSR